MLGLRQRQRVVCGCERREIRFYAVQHICHAKLGQRVQNVQIGRNVKFRQTQIDDCALRLRPFAVRQQKAQRVLVLQQFSRVYTLIRLQQPHPAAVLQRKPDGREAIAVIYRVGIAAVQEVCAHIAIRRVKDVLRGGGAGKFVVPRRAVVERRYQSQNRIGIQLQFACLLGQQVPGMLIDPVAQYIVVRVRPHFPGKRGSIKIFPQRLERFTVIVVPIPQPDRVCKRAGDEAIVPAVFRPKLCGLLLKRVQRLCAQCVENLLPCFTARHSGQHGKRHVDIQRRAHAVFLACVLHQGWNAGREPMRQSGGVGHICGFFLIAFPPCVPVLVVFLGVKVTIAGCVLCFVRILRHGNSNRCSQLLRRRVADAVQLLLCCWGSGGVRGIWSGRAGCQRERTRGCKYNRKKLFHK